MSNDFINSSFMFLSSFVNCLNIIKIIKDKTVQGVDWRATVFFVLWGVWDFYYFPTLNQWWSFIGSFAMTIVNLVWLSLVLYYSYFKKRG